MVRDPISKDSWIAPPSFLAHLRGLRGVRRGGILGGGGALSDPEDIVAFTIAAMLAINAGFLVQDSREVSHLVLAMLGTMCRVFAFLMLVLTMAQALLEPSIDLNPEEHICFLLFLTFSSLEPLLSGGAN